jgi:hypothetical protein
MSTGEIHCYSTDGLQSFGIGKGTPVTPAP